MLVWHSVHGLDVTLCVLCIRAMYTLCKHARLCIYLHTYVCTWKKDVTNDVSEVTDGSNLRTTPHFLSFLRRDTGTLTSDPLRTNPNILY